MCSVTSETEHLTARVHWRTCPQRVLLQLVLRAPPSEGLSPPSVVVRPLLRRLHGHWEVALLLLRGYRAQAFVILHVRVSLTADAIHSRDGRRAT